MVPDFLESFLDLSVAEIVPGMMSLALVGRAYKMVPKDIGKPTKGKKKEADFIKGSAEILVGVPLIGAVANSVAGL